MAAHEDVRSFRVEEAEKVALDFERFDNRFNDEIGFFDGFGAGLSFRTDTVS